MAVAEKLTAMNTANYFAERKNRADYDAFRKILTRDGGQPPRVGDEQQMLLRSMLDRIERRCSSQCNGLFY